MYRIAKPLNLRVWRTWKNHRNRKKHKLRTNNAKYKREKIKQNICYVCKQPFKENDKITLEHIIPKSKLRIKSRYDHPRNLALSHDKCNQLKADK